jgi:hypothetical protein
MKSCNGRIGRGEWEKEKREGKREGKREEKLHQLIEGGGNTCVFSSFQYRLFFSLFPIINDSNYMEIRR